MTDTPRVSVCIPSYNHAKYVRETIESVLAQDMGDFEIVVADDCSTDDTVAVIQSVADPRIRVFPHQRNMGPSIAANTCVAQARGEFISFLPSDDLFEPWKLSRQVAAFEARPDLDAVFGHMRYVDEDGAPLERDTGDLAFPRDMDRAKALRSFVLEGNPLSSPTMMVRRATMQRVGPFDPRLLQTQDYEYWIRLCLVGEIAVLEEPLVRYRIRANAANMDANSPAKSARVDWEIPRILEHFLRLEDEALALRAFPEMRPHLDRGLGVRASLALVALEAPLPWTRSFGVEALYRELGDSASAERLGAAGYGYPFFFRALAEVDPTRAKAVLAAQEGAINAQALWTGAQEARASAAEAAASAAEAWRQREEMSRYLTEVSEARDWFRQQAANWEAEYRRATGQ